MDPNNHNEATEPGSRSRAATLTSPKAPATPRMLKNASSRLSVNDAQKIQYPEIASPPIPQTETFPIQNSNYNPNSQNGNPQYYSTPPAQQKDQNRRIPKLEPLNTNNEAAAVVNQVPQPYTPSKQQPDQPVKSQSRRQPSVNNGNNNNNHKTTSPSHNQQQQQQQQQQHHHHHYGEHQQPSQFHRKYIGEWEFMKTIGAGSMGKVKEAQHRRTNEICAVKIVPRAAKLYQRAHAKDPPPVDAAEHQKRLKEFEKEVARDKRTIREAALGKLLYHPYICRLFEMIPMTNHYYMLFEFVSGGQMLDYIVSHGSLRERHARKFARGIASALDYCHRNNVVHRDLKIENIMISKTGDIKIIDFGLSNLFDNTKLLKTYCGSLYFAAPELLSARPYIGPEVDVWSFGVVLFVLVCGKVPFDDQSVSVLHEKIKEGKVSYPSTLSEECVDMLSKMLVVNPQKRATMKEIINHPWMNKNYDSKVQSYVQFRAPLELPLNDAVLKDIEKLDLGNHDLVEKELTKILSSPEYALCAKAWYEKYNKYITNNVPQSLQDYDDPKYPDPTNGLHPLISIYYLVDEMRNRQLAKERANSEQATSPFSEKYANQQKQQQHQPIEVDQLKQKIHQNRAKPETNQQLPEANNNQGKLESPPNFSSRPVVTLERPQVANMDEVLAFPEAAHTSISKETKVDKAENIDSTNTPNSLIIPEQQLSPKRAKSTNLGSPTAEENKGSGINGLFRRLSGHRRVGSKGASQQSTQQQHHSYVPDSNAPPVPNLPNITSFNYEQASAAVKKKNNLLANNENSSSSRLRKSGSLKYLRSGDNETNELPKRGQRKAGARHNRAVSASAATYKMYPNDNNNSNQNDHSFNEIPIDEAEISKEETKPSNNNNDNRLKPVSHGRSKSIGYKKSQYGDVVPPLPQLDNHVLGEISNNKYEEKPMSENDIIESAKRAEPGSMLSIEYPKTLYLKGFFSVQTTSTKSPAIIRQNIIDSLEKLGVDFLEVKGGFVCTFNPNKKEIISNNPSIINSENMVTNKVSTSQFSNSSSHSDSKDAISSISSKGHRRKFSIGFKKQPTTPKIPSTPILFSPTSPNPNHSIEGESSASLDSLSGIGASDMILSSRINQNNNKKPVQRNPIRFEISVVKIPLVGLYGVQLKKLSGNAWSYKTLADHILTDLRL